MIGFTWQDGEPTCIAITEGVCVYLDNDSLIELSKGATKRRDRFLDAIKRGGTLLFSLTNAAEASGPKGASASAVRGFLSAIGPHWLPLEMDPLAVVKRERLGQLSGPAISQRFMEAYFKERLSELCTKSLVVDLSPEAFFSLGPVVDWLPGSTKLRSDADQMDLTLREIVQEGRSKYESDPPSFDRSCPPIPFDAKKPATFAFRHLFRLLVSECKAFGLKRNDGFDFCHAVLASSYSDLATLDKQWKRRIESLPKPNGLAKIFYRPQVDELVRELETLAAAGPQRGHGA